MDKASLHYDLLPTEKAYFRLLRVLPSLNGQAPVKSELVTGPIAQLAKKYVVGSYLRGPSEPASYIIVNGINVQVRESLAEFLRGCRGRASSLHVWIDVICVNQSDLEERGLQARLLSQIYTNATATYCWLGSDSNFINALKTIERFNIPGSDFTDGSTSFKMGKKEYHPLVAIESACIALMNCDYWLQSWTVPEVVLASRIHLLAGRTSISGYYHNFLDKILRGLDGDFKTNAQSKVNMKKLAHFRRLHTMRDSFDRGVRFDLEQLFETFSSMECVIPQDRLFSLLGLLTPGAAMLLESTVSYSLSGWEILHRVLEAGLIHDYPRFTHLFSTTVLQSEHPPVSTSRIQLPFLFSLHIPEHSASPCPDHKLGPQSDTILSCWWLDYLAHPYELITLSSQAIPGAHANGRKLHTCGLVAPCSTACAPRCTGHALSGVALLWEASFYNRALRSSQRSCKLAWAHTLAGGTADFEEHSGFRLHGLQTGSLSERLRVFADAVVVAREDAVKYRLAADLQTFVRLSRFVMELDGAFGRILNCAFRL